MAYNKALLSDKFSAALANLPLMRSVTANIPDGIADTAPAVAKTAESHSLM